MIQIMYDKRKVMFVIASSRMSNEKDDAVIFWYQYLPVFSFFSEKSTKVIIELLSTYTEDNASQARDDAHR